MKNKQQLIENPEKGSKRQNREMAVVTYLLMAIFFIVFAKTKPDGKEVKTGSGT